MPVVTTTLDLRVAPEHADRALGVVHEVLRATRAFEGCLGVDVLVDVDDPAHLVLLERWESLAADDAYRTWRATPEGRSGLADVLTGPPTVVRTTTAQGV